MSGADEEYFQEEFTRRLSQIGDLRDQLWEIRDRADAATNRTSTLQQNLVRLHSEVGIRKAKANELEDKAALEQARADEISRKIAADASAGVAEVAQLQQRMAELDQAYLAIQADAEEAQQLLVQKEAEVGALRAVLEARTRDAERARGELEQDEAAEEARRQRAAEQIREQGAGRVKDAEASLAVAASETATVRAELSRLERGLVSERECTGGLEKALRHTVEQHEAALEEASALERGLGSLAAEAEAGDLEDQLAASRLKCQYLSQDLANARRHSLMQTQSIQGALEETKRMITDHLDQTRSHIDKTQRSPNDSSLAVLMSALSEARTRADSGLAATRGLERERGALEQDVRQTEAAVAEEKERAGRDRAASVEEELHAARQALDASSRRVGAAVEDERRADAAVAEVERNASDQEAIVRSKLEELWRMLRMYQPGGAPLPTGLRSFEPPLRTGTGLSLSSSHLGRSSSHLGRSSSGLGRSGSGLG